MVARVGDPILCDSGSDTIAEGSGNVFVNGLPAARHNVDLTAGHSCYPPTTITAQVGNPQTVFINGIPAAITGDPIVPHACPSDPPHNGVVQAGSPDVLAYGLE